ncbi:MAG: hypothetical protein JWN95_977 [Frankiales bacterium]|nr:hypothetical protein [Frankiales bacterium]
MAGTAKLRSGFGEGIDIATRIRKPLDPLQLHDWIAQEFDPLNTAWSEIWTSGDQELVRLVDGREG